MNELITQKLLKCSLFKDFEASELTELLAGWSTPLQVHSVNHLIMLRGDAVDSLLVLLDGRLQAQIQGLNGKTLRVEVLNAPCIIASGILFSNDNRLPVSLYTETDVEILSIPKPAVLKLCQSNQWFMEDYFTDMGDKISLLAEKIRLFQFNTIRQKISGYILGLAGPRNLTTVRLLHSKEVFAEILGVARPSLSREFSKLGQEGILEVKGKNVTILDRARLKLILTEEE